MKAERLNAEKAVLSKYLPANLFVFKDMDTESPYLLMGMMTNSGNTYTLRIDLNGFPNSVPHAFVTKMLYTKDGVKMDKANRSMFTSASEHGYTRICHYGLQSWTPNASLFKVYIKCRLWIEMYELHLQTGKPMDYYLKHQF